MLIRAIRAENFMKFREVRIEDLPTQGLVGIEGHNESGKSTLGELIQFALFGKSTSSDRGELLDLIRWDADQCVVEVEFEVEGHGAYRVWREIDRYGTNFTRLTRLADGHDVASGILQAQTELARLLRFDFADFQRSFYLAESDFPRSPNQFQDFLDRMLGVDALLRAADDVKRDVAEKEGQFGQVQSEIKRNDQQIAKYVPNIERIPEIERSRDQHSEKLGQLKEAARQIADEGERIGALLRRREGYRDRLRKLHQVSCGELGSLLRDLRAGYSEDAASGSLASSDKEIQRIRARLHDLEDLERRVDRVLSIAEDSRTNLNEKLNGRQADSYPVRESRAGSVREKTRRSLRRARRGSLVLFILALGMMAVGVGEQFGWFGFDWFAENPSAFPPSYPAEWRPRTILGLIAGGAVLAIMTFVLLARGSRQKAGLREAEHELADLSARREADQRSLAVLEAFDPQQCGLGELPERLQGSGLDALEQRVREHRESFQQVAGEDHDLRKVGSDLARDEDKIIQRLRKSSGELKKERQQNAEQQKREQSKRDRADSEIREYQKQIGRKAELEEQNAKLRDEASEIRDEIDTQQLLLQLLRETVESVRQRAGPSLAKMVRPLLPFLTDGRYRDLKVDPELRLEVFTSEKSDFLKPQELSGGTFEGLSLGFRLAFSEAFVHAVTRQPQFLFLDEPFKAMDRHRIHRTLQAMSRLSPHLRQIFVILPEFATEDRELFDLLITVSAQENRLHSGSSAGEGGSPRPWGRERSAVPIGDEPRARSEKESGSNGAGTQPEAGPPPLLPQVGPEPSERPRPAWLESTGALAPEREDDAPASEE